MSPRAADDRTRTFAALPPRRGSRGPFAESWWGNAWVAALEETSLDPGRLGRGRTYARGGYVDTITVTPGRIAAPVHGSRPRPYRSEVRLRVLGDAAWDRFLDAVAAQAGHIAALLDKDMPHSLVEAAAEAGVGLLPGAGDLDPHCTCPDWGHPCKHAAALCYQTARLLDADPFVLLLMRGRGERELLDEFARRNAARTARETPSAPTETPGVNARATLAVRERPPLPAPLPAPITPAPPPPLPDLPDTPSPQAPAFLITDAATRAHTFLTSGTDPSPGPAPYPHPDLFPDPADPWPDAVRLAATHPRFAGRGGLSAQFSTLAQHLGRKPLDLTRAVTAWRQGGREGLTVLETPWTPPPGALDRARTALAAADLPPMKSWRNRLTDPHHLTQLRYGHDARWYPYRPQGRRPDDWWPQGPPDPDPVGALTGMLDA